MPDAPPTVDAFLDARVAPALRPVAERVRALVREAAPHAEERMWYGLPMWTAAHALAWLSPARGHLTLGFKEGARFDDPHGLLRGTGVHARHVVLRSVAEAEHPGLPALLYQALLFDAA